MSAVEIRDLEKTYRYGFAWRSKVQALRGVSLSVEKGEVYGLLGPNGAGKSTLVKCLLGIVRPTRGQGWLLGRPCSDASVRRHVGFLPEDHRFPDYLSGAQLLDYMGALSGVPRRERRRRAPEILETVGLTADAKRRISSYSKGMVQRIGLGQALLHDPEILFLDEPTDGVDPVGRRQIKDVLLRLRDQGKTVFVSSHQLGEVEEICSHATILVRGKVLRTGTVEQFTGRGLTFQFVVAEPLTQETHASLREMVALRNGRLMAPPPNQPPGFLVEVPGDPELNEIVDLLRARQVVLRGFWLQKQSLEDFFVQAVTAVPQEEATS